MAEATFRAVVIAGVLAACGAAVPPLPSNGGPTWSELTSAHFTMWTDAPLDRARELIREMERMRQIVVGVAFPGAPDEGRNLVIALHDDAELAALSPTGEARAYASSGGEPLWQPLFVLSAYSNYSRDDRTVAHELTHVISFAVVHHQPRWLAEGMAKFFETVELDPDSTTADIGAAPQVRGQRMVMPHLVPISTLFEWERIAPDESREYSTAWALFTFLINEHGPELQRYLELLDQPIERDVSREAWRARVWSEAFPSLSLSTIDAVLQHWLVTGHHVVMHVKLELRASPIAERGLGEPDVLALRALLRPWVPAQQAQIHAEVAAALALEPTNVLAWLVRFANDHDNIPVEVGRAIAAAHPDDWRAWLLAAIALDRAHDDPAELAAAHARMCLLIGQNPALNPPTKCEHTDDNLPPPR
jgi:hypothetical protein